MVKFDKVEFILMVAGMANCLNFRFEPELMGSTAHSRKVFLRLVLEPHALFRAI
jgi:hypothetical protein